MSSIKQKIIERIIREGPISFETFMEMALYYPGLGYYAKESTAIGREGDFYTSPHLHPIFGAMLGRQMEEMWLLMGKPERFDVVEMGAGMGYLAKDMLDYLGREDAGSRKPEDRENCFPHLQYTIIELNPATRVRQQQLLVEFADKVKWVADLQDLGPVSGCFLSNELIDAFPVRLVEMDDELNEIYVSLSSFNFLERGKGESENIEFIEVRRPCSNEVEGYLKQYMSGLSKGYRTEVNLKLKVWLAELNNRLAEGFVLTIDYGYVGRDYYSEERSKGTLLCYYQHRTSENPYQHVGEQDITAHVNFSSMKKWGEELGLKTTGYCPQGMYLISLGIDEVITELYGCAPDPFETARIKGLILPQGMGESHKVMIQYKGKGEPKLRGFGIRNHKGKL